MFSVKLFTLLCSLSSVVTAQTVAAQSDVSAQGNDDVSALNYESQGNDYSVQHNQNTPPSEYYRYRDSIFLPWSAKFTANPAYTPSIKGSIGGRPFNIPIDTGSTGVLLGQPLVPTVQLTNANPRGWQFLDSSSLLLTGQFVDLEITFFGARRDEEVVTKVPVLIVTKVVKCPTYNTATGNGNCPAGRSEPYNQDLTKVIYAGVGFGRNYAGSGSPFGTPATNPFLNIVRINGQRPQAMRVGYTVSTNGVYLGLTAESTKGAIFTQLKKGTTRDPRDWAMVDVAFDVNAKGPTRGKALVDTGVTQMYIQSSREVPIPYITARNPSGPPSTIRRVTPNTYLSFAFPDFLTGVAGYSFAVGDRRFLSQPTFVEPEYAERGTPFANLGRNFLFGFKIAFDAQGGKFGFVCLECRDDYGKPVGGNYREGY